MKKSPLNNPGTPIRTVVVGDSPLQLKILAQTVEGAGNFELVGSATEGYQALRYISSLSPDLVLMDPHTHGLNGIQITSQVKQGKHPPVIIIVNSEDSTAARATAERAGADGFVRKGSNLRRRIVGTLQEVFGPGCRGNQITAAESAA